MEEVQEIFRRKIGRIETGDLNSDLNMDVCISDLWNTHNVFYWFYARGRLQYIKPSVFHMQHPYQECTSVLVPWDLLCRVIMLLICVPKSGKVFVKKAEKLQ